MKEKLLEAWSIAKAVILLGGLITIGIPFVALIIKTLVKLFMWGYNVI
jgi:hypothetical protein